MTGKVRFIALLATFLVAFSVFGTLGVSAATKYEPTEAYKSGKYYSNLCAVDLCGDGVQDTLAIALSQLGYHEGNSDAELDGMSADGNLDFVEYNVLFGPLDNKQGTGISHGYYWCASFVNWCVRQAGVSKEASADAEVSCSRWMDSCKEAEIYNKKTGYTPKSADIVFFKDKESYLTTTHMGLVLYSDGENVYTIEGNTSNGSEFSSNGNYVALKSYPLKSSYIVGYASPKYNIVDGVKRVDYSGKDISAGKYITTDEIDVYSDNTYQTKIGKIDPFTVISVKSVRDGTLILDGGYIKAESVVQISACAEIDAETESSAGNGFENLENITGKSFIDVMTSPGFWAKSGDIIAIAAVLFLIVLIALAVRRYAKKRMSRILNDNEAKGKNKNGKNNKKKANSKKRKKNSHSKNKKTKRKKSKRKKSKKNKKGKK